MFSDFYNWLQNFVIIIIFILWSVKLPKKNCPSNRLDESDKRQVETNSSNKVVHQPSKEKGNPNNKHIRTPVMIATSIRKIRLL